MKTKKQFTGYFLLISVVTAIPGILGGRMNGINIVGWGVSVLIAAGLLYWLFPKTKSSH